MKYYKLNTTITNWIRCDFDKDKRQITLYDHNYKPYGIGLY